MPDDQQSLGSSALLTAGVSSGATTLPLSAAIGVADGRTMRVVCEGEVMLVTAGMGTTSLTVTRGQEGTTAAAHPSGATVQQRLTPAGLANTRTQPNSHAHNGSDGSGTVAHSATTGRTANDHHNQAHAIGGADHTGTLAHTALSAIGTNTHPQIDTHIADTSIHGGGGGGAPAAHATTHQPGGTDAMAVDAAAGTGSLRTLGTTGTSAAAGNDGRLSDARTPTTHASSHVGGGSDAIAAFVASGAGHKSGAVPDPGSTAGTTKFLREDATFAVPPGTGGGSALTIEEVDGTPSVAATKLILPNGTVSVSGTEATYTPSGGGSGDWTLIASVVRGSNGTISFTSIPGTYKHLMLVFAGRIASGAATSNLEFQLNGDTGANYDFTGSGTATGQNQGRLAVSTGDASAAGLVGGLTAYFFDYARTVFHKAVSVVSGQQYNVNTLVTYQHYNVWHSTAAITQITIITTLETGSRAELYGLS